MKKTTDAVEILRRRYPRRFRRLRRIWYRLIDRCIWYLHISWWRIRGRCIWCGSPVTRMFNGDLNVFCPDCRK